MQRYNFFCTYKDFPFFGTAKRPLLCAPSNDRKAPTRHPYIALLVYDTALTQLSHSSEKTYIQLLPEKQKIRTPQKMQCQPSRRTENYNNFIV